MIRDIFTFYNVYRAMRMIHGVYITYSFFRWLLGYFYTYTIWLLTFVYDPYLVKQIKDTKLKNESEKDVHK